MRDVAWRIGFTLTVLAALLVLAPDGNRTRAYHLLEQALGHTPQAEVTRFLTAVAKGDRPTALALWPGSQGADAALETRRKWVLDDLEALGPQLQHRVLEVEWWRTCCEPGVIEDPRQAGAARVRAAVRGVNQPERIYLFDLRVPGGYPGTAAGGRVRQWAIIDVYPEGQAPLAWAWSE